ncbi:hypothetical protein CIHG_06557 [Coccidioides immitis H538.4]|uniref:Uncharacterized protein n=2 Tax=Coccidioides immitis TaxID=5501 RepID=A0A0J8RWW3_COCIT|nr:hypothetical protein CIRG_07971 [Coccidioides immitis RMSCC 2394]KMU88619.1 hypothetical protein CIHG_06557 [Coccidioides immitis H538.4]
MAVTLPNRSAARNKPGVKENRFQNIKEKLAFNGDQRHLSSRELIFEDETWWPRCMWGRPVRCALGAELPYGLGREGVCVSLVLLRTSRIVAPESPDCRGTPEGEALPCEEFSGLIRITFRPSVSLYGG